MDNFLGLTPSDIHVAIADDQAWISIPLPESIVEGIRSWARRTQDERCSRFYATNMYVEDEFDNLSLFWIDGDPIAAGTFDTGVYGEGPRVTGIQLIVAADGPALDYTIPRTTLGLDSRLRAAGIIRRLLEIGTDPAGINTWTQ